MHHARQMTRRTFLHRSVMASSLALSSLLTSSLTAGLSACSSATEPAGVVDTLHTRARERGLYYGAAVQYNVLEQDTLYREAIQHECSMIVAESEMKWNALRPSPTTFTFGAADGIMEFARRHNLLVRGHALCWYLDIPSWLLEQGRLTAAQAERFLVEHIQTVVGRYRGRIHSWDVVNEGIEPDERLPNSLRGGFWYNALGERYIDIAFRAAAAADPQARLTYNDFGLEYADGKSQAKRAAVLNLIRRLQSRNVPIHALGLQAHLTFEGVQRLFDASSFRAFLQQVAALGVHVYITELDIADTDLPFTIVQRDRFIAQAYSDVLTAALESPAVRAVLTWGITDKYTWLAQSAPRRDGNAVRPLPLDSAFRRKAAWSAMADAFTQAAPRLVV
jgi:endo-1,4-beta-xylanase